MKHQFAGQAVRVNTKWLRKVCKEYMDLQYSNLQGAELLTKDSELVFKVFRTAMKSVYGKDVFKTINKANT